MGDLMVTLLTHQLPVFVLFLDRESLTTWFPDYVVTDESQRSLSANTLPENVLQITSLPLESRQILTAVSQMLLGYATPLNAGNPRTGVA